jgi:LacI family transcriptional regulator
VAAAKALIRQMEGLPPAAPAQFTATLVRRGSVGPRRTGEDPALGQLAARLN